MSDFDDNWQLTGSSDPATPDIQPHQVEAQPAQPVFQQPVQPFQNYQPQPAASTQTQTQFQQPASQPAYQQPVYQQPLAQPYNQQPAYQQPAYQQPGAQPYYQQPAYQQPAYQQPAYQQPAYQQPAYQQPVMPGYGYPPQQSYQNNPEYAAEREKNLNECTRMINHFSPKADLYQDYEKCKTDIVRYSRASIAPLVWGIIVASFGLIPLYSAITASYKDTIIGNAVAAGILILIGAGLIVLWVLKKKSGKKKTDALYMRLGELSNELNLLYNGFSNCILPPEYTDPRILFKIQSLIISGRALTVGNALQILLSAPNAYMKINYAKTQFEKDTAARFNGNPAFFNAVRYLDVR